jgi:hypothetical protein
MLNVHALIVACITFTVLKLCHGSGEHYIIQCLLYRTHVPAMIAATTGHAVDKAAELLHDNVCPVCFCKKTGKNPRHQLIMHFRRAVIAGHRQFRTKEYTQHFKVGRRKNPVTHDYIYKTIEKKFGKDIAQIYMH